LFANHVLPPRTGSAAAPAAQAEKKEEKKEEDEEDDALGGDGEGMGLFGGDEDDY
jgi:ribosomal protein L12E/L44/L45/RPP1/RPP2